MSIENLYVQALPADTDPEAVDRLAETAPETVEQAVRLDPAFIYAKIEAWVVGFQRLMPNIAVALVVMLLFVLAAWLSAGASRAGRGRMIATTLGTCSAPSCGGSSSPSASSSP